MCKTNRVGVLAWMVLLCACGSGSSDAGSGNSGDARNAWLPASGFGSSAVNSIEASRTNPALAFAGAEDAPPCTTGVCGGSTDDLASVVFRTDDAGSSWDALSAGLPNGGVLAVDATPDATTLFAVINGTNGGLFASTDAGASWNRRASSPFSYVRAASADGLVLYAASGSTATSSPGLYRSDDGGSTFSKSDEGLPLDGGQAVTALAVDPADPDHVLVGIGMAFGSSGCKGVYTSHDGASSWAPGGLQGDCIRSLVAGPASILAVTSKGGFESTDLGATWENLFDAGALPDGASGSVVQIAIQPSAEGAPWVLFDSMQVAVRTTADGVWHVKSCREPYRPSNAPACASAGAPAFAVLGDSQQPTLVMVDLCHKTHRCIPD